MLALVAAGLLARPASAQIAGEAAVAAEQPVRLDTPTGAIHGTLLLPAGAEPVPAALIIAGSGPTDRDGNSLALNGENNGLRMLAEGLAASGIATVRYDKGSGWASRSGSGS